MAYVHKEDISTIESFINKKKGDTSFDINMPVNQVRLC